MLFKTQLCFLQGISLQSKKSEKKKIINSPSSIVLYYWTSHLTCVTKKLNRKQTMKIPRRKELQQISCRLASSLAARFTCTSLVAKKKQTSKPAAKRSIGSLSTGKDGRRKKWCSFCMVVWKMSEIRTRLIYYSSQPLILSRNLLRKKEPSTPFFVSLGNFKILQKKVYNTHVQEVKFTEYMTSHSIPHAS